MAEKNTSAPQDLIDDGKKVTISKSRSEIAITAAVEIEELCKLMRTTTKDFDVVDSVIRGLSMRVQDLSTIIMGALCDDAEETPELNYRLTGERGEAVAA